MPLTHGSWSYKGNNCDILNQIELECFFFVFFFQKDVNDWNRKYISCNGSRQSPIDIDPLTAVWMDYPVFEFGNYDKIAPENINNNGLTGI